MQRFIKPGWFINPALLLIVFSTLILAVDNPQGTGTLPNRLDGLELVNALRSGGYTLYFRHGITDHLTFDKDRNNLSDCTTQRLLSDEGRKQMENIGKQITALGIRVSSIVSSPYCRCIDTAVLAFGEPQIEEDLKHTVTEVDEVVRKRAESLKRMLATPPSEPGTNAVISGHTANLLEATGIWPKPEGVAIVFKPTTNHSFEFIATILPDDWAALLRLKAGGEDF